MHTDIMKTMMLRTSYLLLLVCTLALAGCADLSVNNPNAPNEELAISNPSDLKAVLSGGYATWWDGTHQNYEPSVHLDGWADVMTTTNAFAGFWDSTNEPRLRFNNSTSYADLAIATVPWRNLNGAQHAANEVINQIENEGLEIVIEGSDQTPMVLASSYFLRGISRGHLAVLFDKAYLPEPGSLEQPGFTPYPEVLAAAVADLERAIEISNGSTFTIDEWLPFSSTYDNEGLSRLASSYAARFIVGSSRTAAENAAVDWTRVRDLASNGIQEDLVLELNGDNWFDTYQYLSGLFWYYRIDNRLLALMSEEYPQKYPAEQAGTALPPIMLEGTEGAAGATYTTSDARIETDFRYDSDQSFFRISRGPTLQSNYFYVRYEEQWLNGAAGPGPIFLAAENDLLLAEAELALGNKSEAISIVNNGTRVTRGELEPLPASASEQDVYNAIFYERDIELYQTGTGVAFFDLRRRNAMQEGTPLHLPVPADELTTVGEPIYTFGGESAIGEEGTADGSNSWTLEGNNPPGMPQQ